MFKINKMFIGDRVCVEFDGNYYDTIDIVDLKDIHHHAIRLLAITCKNGTITDDQAIQLINFIDKIVTAYGIKRTAYEVINDSNLFEYTELMQYNIEFNDLYDGILYPTN